MMIVWPDNFPFMAGGDETPEERAQRLKNQFGGSGDAQKDKYRANAEQRAADSAQRARDRAMRESRGENVLSRLNGRYFIDPDRGVPVQLFSRMTGGTRQWRLLNEDGRISIVGKANRLLDPNTGELWTVGDLFGPKAGRDWSVTANELTEKQLSNFLSQLGFDEGGGGVSADTAASTASNESIAAAQRAHEIELDRLRTQRETELQRIQEENAMKRERLGQAGQLARTAAEVQQRARQWLADTIGVDPHRAAIGGQGGIQRGETVSEQYRGQLAGVASQPIPQVSPEAQMPDIEATIKSLEGMQQLPTAPLGMATGGTIDMGGMTAQQGTTKRGILTGERNFDGDEEVVIIDSANPTHTEVVPLVSAAAEGGAYDVGALAPIFGSMGMTDYGRAVRTPQGYGIGGGDYGTGSYNARRLGYNPRLFRTRGSDMYYYKNPQGQLQHIANKDVFDRSGFQTKDLMYVEDSELGKFGQTGNPLTDPVSWVEGPVRRGVPRSIPLVTPEGIALPDLAQLAGMWRSIELDPQLRQSVTSAYGVAGLGGGPGDPTSNALETIREAVKFFTPGGTAQRAGSARLG